MKPHTFVIACAICLLPIAYSAEQKDLPKCEGNRAITTFARKMLYEEVIAAKLQQENQELDYCCELEKRAFDYVRFTVPGSKAADNVLFFEGSGSKFNAKKVVDSWKGRLEKTVVKFGCNLGTYRDSYKVACVFE